LGSFSRSWRRGISAGKFWGVVALGLVVSLSAFAAACGGDDEEDNGATSTPAATTPAGRSPTPGGAQGNTQQLEAAIQDTADAWNDRDAQRFVSHFTPQALQEQFGATPEEFAQSGADFLGDPPIDVREISNASVSGTTGSADIELAFGDLVQGERWTMVNEGGTWKVQSSESIPVNIPDDVTAVDLGLNEFAFVFNRSEITDGNIAFRVTNEGEQQHEVIIATVPADADLQELIQSPETPEGVEFLGFYGPADPGDATNLVFADDLEAGRYALFCFLEDEETGQPHAALGMVSEFTIE
jgi:hypothetical protein